MWPQQAGISHVAGLLGAGRVGSQKWLRVRAQHGWRMRGLAVRWVARKRMFKKCDKRLFGLGGACGPHACMQAGLPDKKA